MEEIEGALVDIQEISKDVMKTVLGPYVRFDPNRQEFIFTESWAKLNNNLKILTYLIGRKGMVAQGHLSDEEPVAQKVIITQTQLPAGSVGYSVKLLYDGKLIDKTETGKYYVTSAKLLIVKGMIEKAVEGAQPTEKSMERKRKTGKRARRKAS